MKILPICLFIAATLFVGAGCGQTAGGSSVAGTPTAGGIGAGKTVTQKPAATEKTAAGVASVCEYFPKELVESAIGRPIAKMEVPIMGKEYCAYYTDYRPDYNYAPGGNTPGGPSIQVVHESLSVDAWKADKEKGGNKTEKDPTIPMDNFVVRNNTGKVWMAVLVLGPNEYLRMQAIDGAVNAEELVKIATKFAEKIGGK